MRNQNNAIRGAANSIELVYLLDKPYIISEKQLYCRQPDSCEIHHGMDHTAGWTLSIIMFLHSLFEQIWDRSACLNQQPFDVHFFTD